MQYVTEVGANLMASRVFWLIMVVTAASLGVHWSFEVSDLELSSRRNCKKEGNYRNKGRISTT